MKIFEVNFTATEIISLLSLLVAIIAIVTNLLAAYFSRKYSYKEAVFKTLFECAFKEYSLKTDLLKEFSKNGTTVTYVGFEGYIFSYQKLYKMITSKRDISVEDVQKYIKESEALSEAAMQGRPNTNA